MITLFIIYIPKYARAAVKRITIMNGTIPNCWTLIGKLRQPVPKAEANMAKMDPLMVPFLTGRYAPRMDGL